jgi:hypothetical protein
MNIAPNIGYRSGIFSPISMAPDANAGIAINPFAS